jgi:hypothetical protein
MSEEEIKEENEEEKFNIISEILTSIKKKHYEEIQEELINKIKDDYINSLFYPFTKNIIKKLIASDVENIEIIKQKLNTVAYDSTLRKYTTLFGDVADIISVAYDDNYLRINFNIIVKGVLVSFANIEIFQHDYKITIEDKDITKMTKRDLLLTLLKLINDIIGINEDDDYEDDED